jgi:hypothetical protein
MGLFGTLSIMTVSVTTLTIIGLFAGATTLSITTLSIKGLYVTLNITDT